MNLDTGLTGQNTSNFRLPFYDSYFVLMLMELQLVDFCYPTVILFSKFTDPVIKIRLSLHRKSTIDRLIDCWIRHFCEIITATGRCYGPADLISDSNRARIEGSPCTDSPI